MASYNAPIKDIRFILEHVSGISELAQLPRFTEATPDMVDAILEEAGKFCRDVLAPLNRIGDEQGATLENGVVRTADGFAEAWKQFAEGGWTSLPFDPEYGGQGLPWSLQIAVTEMVASACMSFSLCPILTQGSLEALAQHAGEQQKSTYLAKLVSGEWTGTMNLTEPQAGSDLGAIRSRALPQSDGTYLIKGSKIFITFGEHDMAENIIHLVLAKTPEAPAGSKGISLFIVPKFLVKEDGSLGERNDVRAVSLEEKLGIHASPTCVMAFGDDDKCVGYLVGEENKGLRYMFTMMNNARLAVGLQGVAVAERATQQALEFALERKQGRPMGPSSSPDAAIIEHADVRRMLMTMKALTEAARAICYKVAGAFDRAHNLPDEAARAVARATVELITPIAKAWSTDVGCEVASLGVQVHGGVGFIEETGAAQHYRDARILPIYEGTNGIQAMDLVMRKVPLEGGGPLRALIGEMGAFIDELTSAEGELAAMAVPLKAGLEAFGRASAWLGENLKDNPNACAAGAYAYLRMFGILFGGYLLARGAVVAAAELALEGDRDTDFLKSKIVTAHFFAEQILPQAPGLLGPVVAGDELLYALSPNQMAV